MPVTVGGATPGIFPSNQSGTGQGAIFNGVTNVLLDTATPVATGDIITIYCTGRGEVNNPPDSGKPAPGGPNLATTIATPTLTIGGISAAINYSGLTPT